MSDKLSASCSLKISYPDAAGGLVKSYRRDGHVRQRAQRRRWSGTGATRQACGFQEGTYTIEVAATDRAGNAGAIARGTVVAQ